MGRVFHPAQLSLLILTTNPETHIHMANYYSTSRTNYCKFNIEKLRAFIEKVQEHCSLYVWTKYADSLTKEVVDDAVATRRAELQAEVDEKNKEIKKKNQEVDAQRRANMQEKAVNDTKYPFHKEVTVPRDYDIKNALFPSQLITSIKFPELAMSHLDKIGFGFDEGVPYVELEDENEEIEEIDFLGELSLCLEEGQVLVYQEAGAEKMRYVAGVSIAYNHKGECVSMDMNEIYKRAAKEFGVDEKDISRAQY